MRQPCSLFLVQITNSIPSSIIHWSDHIEVVSQGQPAYRPPSTHLVFYLRLQVYQSVGHSPSIHLVARPQQKERARKNENRIYRFISNRMTAIHKYKNKTSMNSSKNENQKTSMNSSKERKGNLLQTIICFFIH